LLTRDFDYPLPPEAVAQQPAARGESRLLVLDRQGEARHRRIADLPRILRRGDLLVVNDTRVLPARLFGRQVGRPGGPESGGAWHEAATPGEPRPRIELLLVERLPDEEGAGTGEAVSGGRTWEVLARPGKRAKPGATIEIEDRHGHRTGLRAEVLALAGDGRRRVRFSEPIEPHLERLGHVPLPPYIHRADEPEDRDRYQTVYADKPGAIAAPTAGLHFSEGLLAELAAAGIERDAVTLHVGLGTFKPVTAPLVSDHRMDRERFAVPAATAAAIELARAEGRRVVAVGTTVVRTLEAAAAASGGEVRPGAGATDLFIAPGFRFRVVDLLLTNFHLPRSTLLMLVAAFAGRERVLTAYQEALGLGYRFFSYGDAMLAERRSGEMP
jgi:S-adenosylmethionine:tRNA ribosyltransferase-isomerase